MIINHCSACGAILVVMGKDEVGIFRKVRVAQELGRFYKKIFRLF
ncbi:hypothetical protein O999_04900 [Pseudomonas putida LF54]|nr:hypothetical protein O999_04900 [Pseudomonas putida LF54]